MNLADVFGEIEQRLRSIEKLNVPPIDSENISVPAALLSLPEKIDYVQAYQRGMSSVSIEFMILISRSNMRAAVKTALEFASSSGPRSVSAAMTMTPENPYTACDDVLIQSCEFDNVQVAGTDYLACVFTASIVGSGG